MANVPRYLEKFTNYLGTQELIFPKTHLETAVRQSVRQPRAAIINTAYALRLRGNDTVLLKDVARATVRFLVTGRSIGYIDDKLAEIEAKLAIAQGYLYYSDGRRALASIAEMPEIETSWESPWVIPVILTFDIWEDFD